MPSFFGLLQRRLSILFEAQQPEREQLEGKSGFGSSSTGVREGGVKCACVTSSAYTTVWLAQEKRPHIIHTELIKGIAYL